MSEVETRANNFIRQIIEDDLATGKHTHICTRFPPEPNGYLHIGHAKSICLNFGFAQDYQGTCHLRFDDTNPVKEDKEFIDAIQQDVHWLGFQWHGDIHYSSDYFAQFYQCALELINKGLAYVDELSTEEIRHYRGTLTEPGKNSPWRDRPLEENLRLFEQMRRGEFAEGTHCLRAKIDMASSYIILRDPVLYRIRFAHHHQTADAWCIYPMYDFAHCISDAIEGITHSLCTLEFQDNRRLYDWVLDHLSFEARPRQYEFSRLNLEYTVMSKRKLTLLVTENKVSGWDDPRMPTISGLRRRGYTASAIREFCHRIGITRQENRIEMAALEACIRDDLNQHAPRAMAVIDPLKVIIENLPADHEQVITMPNHPARPELGERKVPFSREIWIDRADFREQANKHYKRLVLGKEVRLRNAYVIRAERVEKDEAGNILCLYCHCDKDTLHKNPADGRKIKGVIHWVAVAHALPAEFRLYDRLFRIPNPAAEANFLAALNENSLKIGHGYVEPAIQAAATDTRWQFEREGYFCQDNLLSKPGVLIFNRTVELRDTWVDKDDQGAC